MFTEAMVEVHSLVKRMLGNEFLARDNRRVIAWVESRLELLPEGTRQSFVEAVLKNRMDGRSPKRWAWPGRAVGFSVVNAKRLVRDGYDAIASRYLAARAQDSPDVAVLQELHKRLPAGARVLDAGCGAGRPIARLLSQRYAVVGIDLSAAQLALCRNNVPDCTLLRMDMAHLALADATFDAVVSYYAVIHVPREEHGAVFQGFHRVLRPGGLLLATMGMRESPGDVEDFFGVPMYWSHYADAVNKVLLKESGFTLLRADEVPDANTPGSHLFILAKRG